MSQPIYKNWCAKFTAEYYKLSSEEQTALGKKNEASLKQVGAESVVFCLSLSEEWQGWGVEKYPSIEAVEQHLQNLNDLNWFKYLDSKTYLGVEFTQP